MATVTFTQDRTPPPVDERLEHYGAQALLLDKPIKLRFQPDFYDYARGSYTGWTGVSWGVDLEGVEEGRRMREALAALFKVLAQGEASQVKVIMALEGWVVPLVEPSAEALATAGEEDQP